MEPEWLSALLTPTGPNQSNNFHLIQTHISWVILTDETVYKIKKPVDFGFLDYTTLDKRRFFCEEEVRLNRRLCPDIYLGVVPIVRTLSGSYGFDARGETVEWAVKMRRMPEDGIMAYLLKRNEITTGHIDAILDKLVPFYSMKNGGDDREAKLIVDSGGIKVITHNTEENFEQISPFIDQIIPSQLYDAICDYTRNFLKTHADLFERRQLEGHIKDGHGDLYSANICFDDLKNQVYVFDCIEFNDRFRYGDVASDAAFLAMDLDMHGYADIAHYFVSRLSDALNDPDMLKLMDFYKCYRAIVRGKIGCFTWASPDIDAPARQEAQNNALRYFKLAGQYAQPTQSKLYVVYGLSGTGKTTVANLLASMAGIPVYHSDVVRKELIAGIPASERHIEAFGEGIYSKDISRKTYLALARLAARHLVIGEDVVLDATYTEPLERKGLLDIVRHCHAKPVFLHTTCSESEVKRRLANRLNQPQEASDGRWEIYLRQKERFMHKEGLEELPVEVISTEDKDGIQEHLKAVLCKY
ncbi:MAG: AAA family ATPase [Dissulfuribacterales bacterium]